MTKKGFVKKDTIMTATKIETALRGPGKGLRVGKLALLLQIPVSAVYNAVSCSPRICEDDDGRLYYVDWLKTR